MAKKRSGGGADIRTQPKEKSERLRFWQDRLTRCRVAYEDELASMVSRERLYDGDDSIKELAKTLKGKENEKTPYLRNIVRELIEAQIDTTIPQPKVTARRKEDEWKAQLIEDMLRDELNRIPIEEINDLMERVVPLQGGGFYLIEWDDSIRTHTTVGEVSVRALHPDSVIPQQGVRLLDDMDYFFVKIPTTKGAVYAKYHVDVSDEAEEEPELRSHDGGEEPSEETVTVYQAYYRNENGRFGLFSWVGDTVLLDLDDYRARRIKRCVSCSCPEPENKGEDGVKRCPSCGGTVFEYQSASYMTLSNDMIRTDGTKVPRMTEQIETIEDEIAGSIEISVAEPTKIPYYMPSVSPLILQKCVSSMNRFLGDSDAEELRSSQNALNALYKKIFAKMFSGGSMVTLPDDATIEVTGEDMRVVRVGNAANKQLIDVYNLQAQFSGDINVAAQIYEFSRQIIGITDSYQGRRDTTAISGQAKQYAAQLAAGRLESKREMKRSAYARLFEAIFKYKLAYTDEPRDIVTHDRDGHICYRQFNRWDFLEQDAAGNYYWNDQFIFGCDTAAPLAQDRAAMWQETRMYFTQGAYGNPQDPKVRAFFWGVMEQLHYPGAAHARDAAEKEMQAAAEAQKNTPAASGQGGAAALAKALAGGGATGAAPHPSASPTPSPGGEGLEETGADIAGLLKSALGGGSKI